MTTASLIFILAQIADMLLTIYGLRIGMRDANPIVATEWMIPAKVIATVLAVIIMETFKKQYGKFIWAPATIMYIVIVWNICAIGLWHFVY